MNERLQNIRKNLNLTQKEFAEKLNERQAYISRYESGASKIQSELIEKLAKIFNVNAHWLITGEGDMFINKKNVNVIGNQNTIGNNNIITNTMEKKISHFDTYRAEMLSDMQTIPEDKIKKFYYLFKALMEDFK